MDLAGSDQQTPFGPIQAGWRLPRYCRECEVGFACKGECPKNRFLTNASQRKTEHPRHLGRRHRQSNISAYSHGMMGYRTPNIDRIAKEGHDLHRLLRRAELHGRPVVVHHRPVRLPHRPDQGRPARRHGGIAAEDPTIAELLKPLGYATGQFGKNHLGDKDEFLPTVHGFDEFFGNLYHLNAEEEPELRDYPRKDPPTSRKNFGPRGVLHCWADGKGGQNDRGHRPADQKADGDHRRRDRRRGRGFHRPARSRPTSRSSSG